MDILEEMGQAQSGSKPGAQQQAGMPLQKVVVAGQLNTSGGTAPTFVSGDGNAHPNLESGPSAQGGGRRRRRDRKGRKSHRKSRRSTRRKSHRKSRRQH